MLGFSRSLFSKVFRRIFRSSFIPPIETKVELGNNNSFINKNCIDTSKGGSVKIGSNCEFLNGVLLMPYGGSITVGNSCSINPYTVIYGHDRGVIIGDNVLIAAHCVVIPSNHKFERIDIPINQQGEQSKGIIIKDDVWIGSGCRILDGVTIGRGAIVGAGSVVTASVPDFAIYAGVPAKLIRMRNKQL
ncbi:acyltransferase [Pontibacter sp. KCTC 32443]|nr:acyltransferase [Pontibacter sp. KCTC 32443]